MYIYTHICIYVYVYISIHPPSWRMFTHVQLLSHLATTHPQHLAQEQEIHTLQHRLSSKNSPAGLEVIGPGIEPWVIHHHSSHWTYLLLIFVDYVGRFDSSVWDISSHVQHPSENLGALWDTFKLPEMSEQSFPLTPANFEPGAKCWMLWPQTTEKTRQ